MSSTNRLQQVPPRPHAKSTATNICEAFKEDVVHQATVLQWYRLFVAGDILFEDEPRSGRPVTVGDDNFRNALKEKLVNWQRHPREPCEHRQLP